VIFRAPPAGWLAALTMMGLQAIATGAAGTSAPTAAVSRAPVGDAVLLAVPILAQRPERCGPAALAMVMRFHGAGPAEVAWADSAYDPVLRGSLITDLAAAARRAGFEARAARLDPDSLIALLRSGLPPVLLYRRGVGPISRQHYAVLVGWDPARDRWTLHDGGHAPRRMSRGDLLSRWSAVGSEALIVRRPSP